MLMRVGGAIPGSERGSSENTMDMFEQLLLAVWLGQHLECVASVSVLLRFFLGCRRQLNFQMGIFLYRPVCQFTPVHITRHQDVGEKHIDLLVVFQQILR